MRIDWTSGLTAALLALCALPVQAAPRIQHWQAPTGAQVYFVEDHDLPMLDVAVNFPAGSAYDSPDNKGVAGLVHGLLDLGVEGMDEDQIARRLADVGAQLGGSFDADRASVSLRTLSSAAEREAALAILAQVLQHPTFPEPVLAREKARQVAALREAETKPEYLAEKAFGQAVFGNHPYGWQTEAEDIEKIERAQLLGFYRAHYRAGDAVVALMGDISRREAEAMVQRLTGELAGGRGDTALPPVVQRIAPSEQRIAHPASQSHILLGAPGIARNDADYFPLYVGNYVLGGGGFVSRLMNEVREKRGLAYSVYSYFMPMRQPGAFQIGLQTKKEQADEALQLVRRTLEAFVADGPTSQELQAAKDNLIGGFPLRIDSNKKILDYLSVIGFYGLPLTYLDDFSARVEAVTVPQVRDAFRRRMDPQAMATVLVGAPGAAK